MLMKSYQTGHTVIGCNFRIYLHIVSEVYIYLYLTNTKYCFVKDSLEKATYGIALMKS